MCSEATIRSVSNIIANGENVMSNATIMSELSENNNHNLVMNVSIDGSNGEGNSIHIYCNESDSCEINCFSNDACNGLIFYCAGLDLTLAYNQSYYFSKYYCPAATLTSNNTTDWDLNSTYTNINGTIIETQNYSHSTIPTFSSTVHFVTHSQINGMLDIAVANMYFIHFYSYFL